MMVDDIKISNALAEVGILVSSIYDLVNSKSSYSVAIPVLIGLLDETFASSRVTEGIVRALTVKEARGKANKALLRKYNETPPSDASLRWAIGNALAAIIVPDDENEVLRIVTDAGNGTSRQMFVLALGKIRSAEVEEALIMLLDDNEVSLHAIAALRKHGTARALPKMQDLTSSRNSAVRKAANAFLKRFAVQTPTPGESI